MGEEGRGVGSQRIIWGISGRIICSDEKCAACSGNLVKLYLAQKLQHASSAAFTHLCILQWRYSYCWASATTTDVCHKLSGRSEVSAGGLSAMLRCVCQFRRRRTLSQSAVCSSQWSVLMCASLAGVGGHTVSEESTRAHGV